MTNEKTYRIYSGSTLYRLLYVCKMDRRIINNVNDFTIPDEFRRWVYGTDPVTKKKIKLPGLVKRREWEASMYEDL